MTLAVDKAAKLIHDSGFTHIKVELEAQLFRDGRSYDSSSGCAECNSLGYLIVLNGAGKDTGGRNECGTCNGMGKLRGKYYDFDSTSRCCQFLKDHISEEANKAMNFFMFYRDGSVDSELTFTLPILKYKYIIEVINAWNELAKRCEQSGASPMQVSGAGMHITTLTSGTYPTSRSLNSEKLKNFNCEVSKLLPALFIAGTSGNFTRGLNYRQPQISNDNKYSAIFTHKGTCFEYRLFETCYQRPKAIYEYICVIARTLEYYNDPSKKVSSLDKQFPIYDRRGLEGFTCLPEQIEIIKKQFDFLKPEGMSVKKFMEERGIDLSVKKMTDAEKAKIKKIKLAYKEHLEAYEKQKAEPLSEYQLDAIEYFKRMHPNESDDWYRAQVTQQPIQIEDEDTFISKNLRRDTPTLRLAV